MNISNKNLSGKCNLKCAYHFKYSESASIAKNDGILISLTYDNSSSEVTYNSNKYKVDTIQIVSPSLHKFNGNFLEGELLINHVPTYGGNNLTVCIPITKTSSNYSEELNTLLNELCLKIPNEKESTNVNIDLQTIVPIKPYYVYSKDSSDYIVYGKIESLSVDPSNLSQLAKIISKNSIDITGKDLFYNSKGPTTGESLGDGIYISCQPTGTSNETTDVTYDKNTNNNDISENIKKFINSNKTVFIVLLSVLAFVFFLFALNLIYKVSFSNKENINIKYG